MSEGIETSDQVVRALTRDGAFRVIGAITTETVRTATAAQEVEGVEARRLAELMTGAVLVRETTSPSRRVQIALEEDGGRRAVADAHPDGKNRGLVGDSEEGATLPEGQKPPPGEGRLTVSYTLPNADLQQGIVAVPEEGSVSKALMTYLQESEQIVSVLEVAALPATGELGWAGGFVVQLLPEAERDTLAEMTQRLSDRAPLVAAQLPASAHELVAELLEGFDHEVVARSPLHFGCTCSRERVVAALRSLSQAELEEMLGDGEPIEARCDACGATYEIEVVSVGDA